MSPPKPPEQVHPLAYAGIFLIFGLICIAAFNPQFPLIIAIPLGVLLGAPLLIWGMRLAAANRPEAKPFLPSGREAWGILAFLLVLLVVLAPFALLLPLYFIMPSGDGVPMVALRLLLVGGSFASYAWWIHFAGKNFPEYFRGKLSDKLIDSFKEDAPPAAQCDWKQTALGQWNLLLIALIAFIGFFGLFQLDHPFLQFHPSSRKARQVTHLITWCRGNPNTSRTSALLVGFGALALYAYRIRQAHLGKQEVAQDSTLSPAPESQPRLQE